MDRRLLIGIVLLVVSIAVRALAVNRHVRQRALLSTWMFAADVAIGLALRYAVPEGIDARRHLDILQTLLLTFGIVNLVITIAINPLRSDRLPDRFPNIVQDAIIIGLFAGAMTVIQPSEFAATTAIGAVVLGLALQETLGNLFAGLAIQIEKPFNVGHWIHVTGQDGRVAEITWRATRLRTKSGNVVVVPNSVLARETITNYSVPTPQLRLEVEVGVTYDAAPTDVKAVIRAALSDEPLIDQSRDVDVLVVDFASSAIVYRVRVWMTDFTADEALRDSIRTRIWYAFRRHHIEIPYPVQVEMQRELPQADVAAETAHREAMVRGAAIFSALEPAAVTLLARAAKPLSYGARETIVREGDAGESMFLLARGEARVSISKGGATEEVARLRGGAFFGEMSLLTGDPRTATVIAVTDCDLLELSADGFRQIVADHPAIVDAITEAMARRRVELGERRASLAAATGQVAPEQSVVARIRAFLGLSSV